MNNATLASHEAELVVRILRCPDCNRGLREDLLCESCGRSFMPDNDGIITALPAAMIGIAQNKEELQRTIDSAGAGEHGEKIVLYEKAFHDEQAPYYDSLFAEPLPLSQYYRHLVQEQIYSHVRERPFVVDLCCGTGKSSMPLAERGMRVIAMDVSREMLRNYARKCAARGLDRVIFVHADASHPPLLASSCGAISMVGGLHHIRDQHGSLMVCCDALCPGGFLLLHEPLKTGSTSRWARVMENIYALTDPARLWRAMRRRMGQSTMPTPSPRTPVPDFTPYEKPFASAGELLAHLPGGMETLLLHSQGLLSFRDFPSHFQNRLGIPLARMIVQLDSYLSRTGRAHWSGDAVFGVFRKVS